VRRVFLLFLVELELDFFLLPNLHSKLNCIRKKRLKEEILGFGGDKNIYIYIYIGLDKLQTPNINDQPA